MSEYDAKSICRKHYWTWKNAHPEHGIFCMNCGKPDNKTCAYRFRDRYDRPAICLKPRGHIAGHIGEVCLDGTKIKAYEREEDVPDHIKHQSVVATEPIEREDFYDAENK